MKFSGKQEASGLVGLAVFGWAFPGVFVRLMPHLPPLPLVFLRLTTGLLALAPFLFSQPIREGVLRAVRNWRCWVLSLGMLSYYAVATPAFLYAPVGKVAMIIASAPLFAVILRLAGRQVVSRWELIGAGLALLGVAVMATPSLKPSTSNYGPEWLGILLAVMAAISAAAYAIGNRHLVNLGQSPGAIAQVMLSFILGLGLLPSLLFVPFADVWRPNLIWLLPLGVVSTALPTAAVAASSHRISPIAVTMINPLTSVCASIVAAAALHEAPTVWAILGGVLVVIAVVVASAPSAKLAAKV